MRVLGGGAGPSGRGGAILRRAGELVRIAGEPLAEAALGRVGSWGGADGAVGVEGTSPPGVLRGGIAGAMREGADDTGLVGGGGGGARPSTTDDPGPGPFRAGRAGGRRALRAGGAGTAADGADVACV
jgi:hypothetical protein